MVEEKADSTPVTKDMGKDSKYSFTKYLNIGSVGNGVQELQKLLKDLGYFTYTKITDYFGDITKKAVQAFQKAKGIDQVGWVGPQTRSALNK
ncbi:MAG: peptidoglycan-binding domain-containing protein [bacterium]